MFCKVKLLNINGAAKHLIKGYSGDTISPLSDVNNVNIVKSKENVEMVDCVLVTLKNLIKPENLNVDINTGLGFSIGKGH